MPDFAEPDFNTDIDEATRTVSGEPELYKVVLLNDHYTTMDFVVEVIRVVFHKTAGEATRIMLDVHKKGKGVVGVYPLDIATTKVRQVEERAREREFPLECVIENI
jgi:ATP-dependent Clp protease adaptor protein ClpS